MSTTDTRAAFEAMEAWKIKANVIGSSDGLLSRIWLAAWQAATEAAKATGTAGELPPIPRAFKGQFEYVVPGKSMTRIESGYTADQMREYGQACVAAALAAASPQPVAKVLSESDIHAIIDSLPETAFEPTIAIGEITALFDDDNGEDVEVLESIKAYAKIVAFRALAASTPTTLTEKKE